MTRTRIIVIIAIAWIIPCTRAFAGSWFDDLAQLRQATDGKAAGSEQGSPRAVFGAGPCTWTVWIKTKTGGPLIASCPAYGDWGKSGKVLSVNGALFYEGRGARMRGRSRKVRDGQWRHVAFVSGSPSHMYVDGKLDSTKEIKVSPDVKSHIMKIGYVAHDYPWFERPAKFFAGAVDDLRYYDRELTADEIAALAGGSEPSGRGAVSRWTFDTDGRDSIGPNHALFSKGVAKVAGRIGGAVEIGAGAHVAIFQGDSFARLLWQLGEKPNDPTIRKQVAQALAGGILKADCLTASPKAMAQRYCKAVSVPRLWRMRAEKLAAEVKNASDLKAIHEIWVKSKSYGSQFASLDAARSLAVRTLDMVVKVAKRPDMRKRLAVLARQVDQAAERPSQNIDELEDQIAALRREIIFSHPALAFDDLLINKRTSSLRGHMVDQYLGRHSSPGTGLTLVESWKDKPRARAILTDKLPPGMTFHPDISYDGKRVVFSFCSHAEKDKTFRRFWIYEASVDGVRLRQLTGTPVDKLEAWGDRRTVLIEDWDPCYLPDGGFAFRREQHSSTIVRRGKRVGPGRPQRWADSLLTLGLHRSQQHDLPEPLDHPARRHGDRPLLRELHAGAVHAR